MAVVMGNYRVKRQHRRRAARGGKGVVSEAAKGGSGTLVAVGTVGSLGLARSQSTPAPSLSVWIGGRYEVRVGPGFEEATLARLVRTLEGLA